MAVSHRNSEGFARGARMLRTALGAAIARLLEDPGVVEVMWRLLRRGAAGQCRGGQEHGSKCGFTERRVSGSADWRLVHSPISLDHEIALT